MSQSPEVPSPSPQTQSPIVPPVHHAQSYQAMLDHTRIIKYHTLKYVCIIKKNKIRVLYVYYYLGRQKSRIKKNKNSMTSYRTVISSVSKQ